MTRVFVIDFASLFSLVSLGIAPFHPAFWFFIPVATAWCVSQDRWLTKIYPLLSFATLLLFNRHQILSFSSMDLLSAVLFYLFGVLLARVSDMYVSKAALIFYPLLGSFFMGLILAASTRYFAPNLPVGTWIQSQLDSDLFPHFFRPLEWGDKYEAFYEQILKPSFEAGIFGWFGAMMAMAFFINGLVLNLFQNSNSRRNRLDRAWEHFDSWKAPDAVLIALVLGLLLLCVHYLRFIPGPFDRLGWTLAVLALYGVFVQGVALASYVMPRLSPLIGIGVFVLLLMYPVAVLVLAGLLDLWFDFRARMRSSGGS